MKLKYFTRKQTFLFILALFMIFSLLPTTVVAANSTSYVALTSDVHGSDSNLQSWLNNLKESGVTSLNYFIFGGDYPTWGNETTASSNATAYRTMVKNAFDDVPVALTRGNHDTSGDYGSPYDKGLQYDGSDFAVYVLPAYELNGVSSGVYYGQGFSTAEMNELDLVLGNIDSSKPVFVASHFPLHYYDSRTSTNASAMIDLLNKYSNVIFVWGHNHTLGDTNYGLVKKAGDSIQYTSSSSATKTINFTYAACGGMMDGASQNIHALLVSLIDNVDSTAIKFQYQNVAGAEQASETVILDTSGGTTPDPDPEPGTGTYELATNIEEGGQYLIVAKSDSNYYALTTDTASDKYLAAQQVTVTGNTVDASSVNAAKMVRTFTADGNGFDVKNGANYLNRDSGSGGGDPEGLFVSATESGASYSDWIYSGNKLYVYNTSGSTDFNLILGSNNSYFQASSSSSISQEIYLYK
ncbi:MAG: metallophosphoesterase, partial [Clostridiaceae bacterium]|nr:metallophosphoesterase [Clostridiaceae bacterium]